MSTWHHVSTLVLRQLLNGACEAVGILAARESSEAVVAFLGRHFSDHSQRLTLGLQYANERAWQTLEIALAGESLWDRCRELLAPRDQQAFLQEVRLLLDATPLAGLPGHGPEFRRECLRQLRAARKAGALTGDALEPRRLAEEVGALARFGDPLALLDAEQRIVEQAADEVRRRGYAGLAELIVLRPPDGPPMLVAAARYFFRRQVEEDRELFQGLAFAQLEQIGQSQQAGFAILAELLMHQSEPLERLLADVFDVVIETHADVRDIKTELARQGQQFQELGQAVLQALEQKRPAALTGPVQPPLLPPPDEPFGHAGWSGHTDAVSCVAFPPDGRYAASGSKDMSVRVWEVATGREHRCLVGHSGEVASVAFFPDGRRLLSAGADTTARIWDVQAGVEQRCHERRTNLAAALSPDGLHVLSGSLYDGMVRLWHAESGEELRRLRGHSDFVYFLAFSPDARRALSGSNDQTVCYWDLANGRILRRLQVPKAAHANLSFSPDGRTALMASPGFCLSLWDLGSGRELRRFSGHLDEVRALAFSPDGARAVSGSADRSLRVWDVPGGKELACLRGHRGAVTSVAVSPDGRYVLSGSEDHGIRLWKLSDV